MLNHICINNLVWNPHAANLSKFILQMFLEIPNLKGFSKSATNENVYLFAMKKPV